jgi:hypothetical protein
MPGPEDGSTSAAPVVAAAGDQNEHQALRRLMQEKEMPRGEAMERGDSSGLSEAPDSSDEKENSEDEEEEGKNESDNGRPAFPRADPDRRRVESTQEFFNRSRQWKGDNIFDTPGKSIMGGSLARALTAAKEDSQEVGMALTLDVTAQPANGMGSEGGGERRLVGARKWSVWMKTWRR